MYPLLGPSVDSCPQCGCADVERMGRHSGNYRYMCLEGHMFEVPKAQSALARWRGRESRTKSATSRNTD